MYPPQLVAPMKADLTSVGFQELLTAEDVDNFISNAEGTTGDDQLRMWLCSWGGPSGCESSLVAQRSEARQPGDGFCGC